MTTTGRTDPVAVGALAQRFRAQAESCLPGSPLYHRLLHRAADDLEAGGVVAEVMAGHERDRPGSVPSLRLMGAVHRLVLAGAAPELAAFYPTAGGTAGPDDAWPAFADALGQHRDAIRGLLPRTMQTNEVGRCAALYGALLVVQAATGLPVRLLEIGASAGLNLNVDAYGYLVAPGRLLGDPAGEVRLVEPWVGAPGVQVDVPLRIVERRGCDPHPVDATTEDGRLTVMSYVWADWTERVERLRGAFAVAARRPPVVDRAHAAGWLSAQLARPAVGKTTVVWHSVTWQYLEQAERERTAALLEAAAKAATRAAPVAHLRLEPRRNASDRDGFDLRLTLWPHGADRLLARTPGHGIPTRWEPA